MKVFSSNFKYITNLVSLNLASKEIIIIDNSIKTQGLYQIMSNSEHLKNLKTFNLSGN